MAGNIIQMRNTFEAVVTNLYSVVLVSRLDCGPSNISIYKFFIISKKSILTHLF